MNFIMSYKKALIAGPILLLTMVQSMGAQAPYLTPPDSQANNSQASVSSAPGKFYENWSVLTLDSSKLDPIPPVLGERDESPKSNYIRERLQLDWRPADPLDLYVVLPKGVKKPPVVLYLYSFPSETDRFNNDKWCSAMTADGYAAVGFVSAFTGHRVDYRSLRKTFTGELQEALATTVHDVQMILNYLTERGDLDMDRVGMYGQGSGGTIAILASAADPRIKAIDVLTPWEDWPQFFAKAKIVSEGERARDLSPDNLAKLASLDPIQWLPKVKAQSVRIQNVREDPNVPAPSQQLLENAAPPFAEINQFGDFRALVPSAAGGRMFEWLRVQLQTGSKPQQLAADKAPRVHFYPAMGGSLTADPLNPTKP